MPLPLSDAQRSERNGYLTTTGRVSGQPHEIEIWFAVPNAGRAVYLLSGGGDRSDWVRNIDRDGAVTFRILGETFRGAGRRATPAEDQSVREAVVAKYYGWSGGELPNDWARTALPVVIELTN
ncbi:MAG TPA: nitroreductase/quinone reductase family protein [Thermomicrobiales bacterium]|jgi:deazaflavin-dependent oxidoreductase (nitroreductase family)|nr:nitroreductase/quinone reductase family protein [Thermomicrobiales bacterium]